MGNGLYEDTVALEKKKKKNGHNCDSVIAFSFDSLGCSNSWDSVPVSHQSVDDLVGYRSLTVSVKATQPASG